MFRRTAGATLFGVFLIVGLGGFSSSTPNPDWQLEPGARAGIGLVDCVVDGECVQNGCWIRNDCTAGVGEACVAT